MTATWRRNDRFVRFVFVVFFSHAPVDMGVRDGDACRGFGGVVLSQLAIEIVAGLLAVVGGGEGRKPVNDVPHADESLMAHDSSR